MNRVILRSSDLSHSELKVWTKPGCIYRLTDQFRTHHLNKIIGINAGDEIRVCLLNWGNGTCRVNYISSDQVVLRLERSVQGLNDPMALLLGLCRPPSLRKVIEHSTSMGVTHFFIVKCALSEKSYLNSKWLREEKLKELLDLGIAQDYSVSRMPTIQIFKDFDSFIEDSDLHLKAFQSKLVLSPEASQWMEAKSDCNCFAVGPERGFTERELKQLRTLDFSKIKVSKSILRVEHACFYGLAQLEYSKSEDS
tara:strand:+ start:5936 stop:6691 length:756 start_codon:yes stop_codon:yes gene_type:complete